MSEHKQNGSVFEDLTSNLNVEGAKKFAAWYIDTSEKVAKQAIEFQASATKWAKETPLAPIFDAQIEYGKKFVERSASAAPALCRLEYLFLSGSPSRVVRSPFPLWEGVRG